MFLSTCLFKIFSKHQDRHSHLRVFIYKDFKQHLQMGVLVYVSLWQWFEASIHIQALWSKCYYIDLKLTSADGHCGLCDFSTMIWSKNPHMGVVVYVTLVQWFEANIHIRVLWFMSILTFLYSGWFVANIRRCVLWSTCLFFLQWFEANILYGRCVCMFLFMMIWT